MSASRDELDRSDPASPYKLDKAHERGSIVRSADVTIPCATTRGGAR